MPKHGLAARFAGATLVTGAYALVRALVPLAVGEGFAPEATATLFGVGLLVAFLAWPLLVPGWEQEGWAALKPDRDRLAFVAVGTPAVLVGVLAASWLFEGRDAVDISDLAGAASFVVVAYLIWPRVAQRSRRDGQAFR